MDYTEWDGSIISLNSDYSDSKPPSPAPTVAHRPSTTTTATTTTTGADLANSLENSQEHNNSDSTSTSIKHTHTGWARGRSRSSTSVSATDSSTADPPLSSGLVMPSMRLPSAPPATHRHHHHHHHREIVQLSKNNLASFIDKDVYSDDYSRILILGKSSEDRRALASILSQSPTDLHSGGGAQQGLGGGPHSTTDLSCSLLSSTRLSERSRNSSTRNVLLLDHDLENCLEEYGRDAPTANLWLPRLRHPEPLELRDRLRAPLEKLEALLNPSYPTTQSLADLATLKLRGELEACLVLLSSPPTLTEVAYARTVSQVIPIFPVLVLQPSPTSKPQKTSALVAAVCQQLTSAGVRWIPAFPTLGDTRPAPLYLISQEALDEQPEDGADDEEAEEDELEGQHSGSESSSAGTRSGPPSASSSQELPPLVPSPVNQSSAARYTRSASPAGKNDVQRLRALVSFPSSRERIRRNRAISFLEWREIEIAARGQTSYSIENLPVEWDDRAIDEGEHRDQLRLDFSKRVAERRRELLAGKSGSGDMEDLDRTFVLPPLPAATDGGLRDFSPSSASEERHLRSESPFEDAVEPRSFISDPMTPKCSQRPLPLSSSSLSSRSASRDNSHHQQQRQQQPHHQQLSSSHISLFSSSPSFPESSFGIDSLLSSSLLDDPFHLPSLLHLVGLNLRLSLLPSPVLAATGPWKTKGVVSWLGTAAMVSVLFLAGYVCGTGQAKVAWKEVWRVGRFAVGR
ncbi:hypothetical protein T439DRAFT_207158 [Meredithblackwellia eburnea MCA 4105]